MVSQDRTLARARYCGATQCTRGAITVRETQVQKHRKVAITVGLTVNATFLCILHREVAITVTGE